MKKFNPKVTTSLCFSTFLILCASLFLSFKFIPNIVNDSSRTPDGCSIISLTTLQQYCENFTSKFSTLNKGKLFFASQYVISRGDLETCRKVSGYKTGLRVCHAVDATKSKCIILMPLDTNYHSLNLDSYLILSDKNLCPQNCDFGKSATTSYAATSISGETAKAYIANYASLVAEGKMDNVKNFIIQDYAISQIINNNGNLSLRCYAGFNNSNERKIMFAGTKADGFINTISSTIYLANSSNLCPMNCD